MDSSPQQTAQWRLDRLGKCSASKVSEVIARTKSGYSTSRANYAAKLICERLTGQAEEGYTNAAMQHGIDSEAQARAAYEFITGNTVQQVGFIIHPSIADSGASPDGLVGDDGLIEIKCPLTATHLETLLGSPIPHKYICQMQWQMACTGRAWCDFTSFDPRLPIHLQLKIQRVERDNAFIAELSDEIIKFLEEVTEKVDKLNNLKEI